MQVLSRFSIKPLNKQLYDMAFIHESYANENGLKECYERLEFIGDAVLDLVISEYLYNQDKTLSEGELTRLRSNYVCKKALFTYSQELGLVEYIKLGAGAELSRREMDSVIADVFESLLGALYLDQGLEMVKEFLKVTIIPHIKNDEIFFYDYKSQLKQLCDQLGWNITYKLHNEEGKSHNKTFTMLGLINGEEYGRGQGGSKKEAEQNAARMVLQKI